MINFGAIFFVQHKNFISISKFSCGLKFMYNQLGCTSHFNSIDIKPMSMFFIYFLEITFKVYLAEKPEKFNGLNTGIVSLYMLDSFPSGAEVNV